MSNGELIQLPDPLDNRLTRRGFMSAAIAGILLKRTSQPTDTHDTEPSSEAVNPLDLFNYRHITVLDNIPGAPELIGKPVSGVALNLTDLFNKDIALSATHNGIPIRLLQIQFGIMDTATLWGVNASIHLGFGSARRENLYLTLGNLESLYIAQQQLELLKSLQYQEDPQQEAISLIIPVLNGSHRKDDLERVMNAYGVSYVINQNVTRTSEGQVIFVKAICGENVIFVEGGVPYEGGRTFDITNERPIIGDFLDYIGDPYKAEYQGINVESA